MRNLLLGLCVLVGIALAPFTACAQPSISEIADCHEKMLAFSQDLSDLANVTQGVDQEAALEIGSIAIGYTQKMLHIRDLLYVLTLIKNNDARNRVKSLIAYRIEVIPMDIDVNIQLVTLHIAGARSQAIILTGTQVNRTPQTAGTIIARIKRIGGYLTNHLIII